MQNNSMYPLKHLNASVKLLAPPKKNGGKGEFYEPNESHKQRVIGNSFKILNHAMSCSFVKAGQFSHIVQRSLCWKIKFTYPSLNMNFSISTLICKIKITFFCSSSFLFFFLHFCLFCIHISIKLLIAKNVDTNVNNSLPFSLPSKLQS